MARNRRYCVFCGEPPTDKTNEHVIPRWLIEMTGSTTRSIRFPLFRLDGTTPPNLTFDGLSFPACAVCNNAFSNMEVSTKKVISNILSNQLITVEDVDLLLDWLDKVRIGLWLGVQMLEKNRFDIAPKFHISTRVGTRDRMLAAYRIDDEWKGISLFGINTPAFHYYPSCFAIAINSIVLFNISDIFLFSRRVGFPHPIGKIPAGTNMKSEIDVRPGINRIHAPLLRLPYLRSDVEIFQPMFSDSSLDESRQLYDNNYVRTLSLDFSHRRGFPLIQDGRNVEKFSSERFASALAGAKPWDRGDLFKKMLICTYTLQREIPHYLYTITDKSVAKLVREIDKITNKYISLTEENYYLA